MPGIVRYELLELIGKPDRHASGERTICSRRPSRGARIATWWAWPVAASLGCELVAGIEDRSPPDVASTVGGAGRGGGGGAACAPVFGGAAPVPGLNTSATDSVALTSDELDAYPTNALTPLPHHFVVYHAARNGPSEPFGSLEPIAELDDPAGTGADWVSDDQLVMLLHSPRTGSAGDNDIWLTTRPSRTQAFSDPVPVSAINTASTEVSAFFAAGAIYFSTNRTGNFDIWRAYAPAPAAQVPLPSPVAELNLSSNDQASVLTQDGRTIYFASEREQPTSHFNIWVACFDDATAHFSTPWRVESLFNDSSDFPLAISADGRALYFQSYRVGGPGEADVWVARRID